jgi:hypothetical protein
LAKEREELPTAKEEIEGRLIRGSAVIEPDEEFPPVLNIR